jgi:undecaprenyl-diphosphatase
MSLLQALILGILQGLTEFLPVSSSGHLILAQSLFGLDQVALKGFDIAINAGTLLAVFIYFRKDFGGLIMAALHTIGIGKPQNQEDLKAKQNLIVMLILGTIPAVLVGLFLGDWLDAHFLNPVTVPVLLIIVAVIFLIAEKVYGKMKHVKDVNMKNGLIIGCAQALALMPGVSRSGSTITAGLFLGIEREKAARYSFLLGSVAITAATVFAFYKGVKGEYAFPAPTILIAGIVSSFVAGIAAISFLLNYLKGHSLALFAYYRIAVALAFMAWFYFGMHGAVL